MREKEREEGEERNVLSHILKCNQHFLQLQLDYLEEAGVISDLSLQARNLNGLRRHHFHFLFISVISNWLNNFYLAGSALSFCVLTWTVFINSSIVCLFVCFPNGAQEAQKPLPLIVSPPSHWFNVRSKGAVILGFSSSGNCPAVLRSFQNYTW